MTPAECQLVTEVCAQRAGLQIDPDKAYLIENRLAPVARREGFESVADLLEAVRQRGEERLIWAMVEAMSPTMSGFFHEPEAFRLIAEEMLPEIARQREGGRLRVWNAACGAGQEAYSLAMALQDQPRAEVTIDLCASDLCSRRLEKAQAGLYSQFEVQRGLPARRLVDCFEKQDDLFGVLPRIRERIGWRRVNLLDDLSGMGQFDLVMCRNLMNSFTEDARRKVVKNLAAVIAPGGCLVLGSGEYADLACDPRAPGFYRVGVGGVRAAA